MFKRQQRLLVPTIQKPNQQINMKSFKSFTIYPTCHSNAISDNNPGGIYSRLELPGHCTAELFGGGHSATGDGINTYDVRLTNRKTGDIVRLGHRVRTRGVTSDQVSAIMMEHQRRQDRRQQHQQKVARYRQYR